MSQNSSISPSGPHAEARVLTAGRGLDQASAAIVLVHGRGASAESILSLRDELDIPQFAALAPEAAGHSWYPQSFLAPLQANQPWLDSALQLLERIVSGILDKGISSDHIALLGFSQGACLILEYIARYPRHYGAVMGFTGGLIGPEGTPRKYPGTLSGTPVFLGAGDPDPHVPFQRVQETQATLQQMRANVDLRRYPGMPHSINNDELEAARTMLKQIPSHREGNAE